MTTINALNERIIKLQDKQIKDLEKAREIDKELHAAELKHTVDLYSGAVAHVAAERDAAIELAESYRQDVQHWQAQAEREHNAFVQAAADRDQAIRDKAALRKHAHALKDSRDTAVSELEKALTKQASLEQERDELKHKLEIADRHEVESDQACDECKEHTDELFAELQHKLGYATEFIDSIVEMVACDADLSDIADECMRWRRGEWSHSIEDLVGSIIDEDPGSFFGGETIEDMEAEDLRRSDPNAPYRWKVMVVEHSGDEAVFTGWFANYDLARESVDLMVARGCYEAWVEELL